MPQSRDTMQQNGSSAPSFEYTVDLSPETCIERWRQVAINPTAMGLTSIEVQTTQLDGDDWDYQVSRYSGRRLQIQVRGSLHRVGEVSTLISGSAKWNAPHSKRHVRPLEFIPGIVIFVLFAIATRGLVIPLVMAGWLSLGFVLNGAYMRHQEQKFVDFLCQAVGDQSVLPERPLDNQLPTLEERKSAVFVNQFLIWVAVAGVGFIFSTVVYLRHRHQSSFVTFHALQAMLWQLIVIGLFVLALLLANSKLEILGVQAAVFIMIADWIFWGPCTIILTVVAGGKISKGQKFRYPVIGNVVDRMLNFER